MATVEAVRKHLARLAACAACPRMHKPVVVGRPVASRVLLVGQAPGDKEPKLGRPFAWTAGKTLFKWFNEALGWTEDETRDRVYFAAVCRCFPGKKATGGDRVPDDDEIAACARWLDAELDVIGARLVRPLEPVLSASTSDWNARRIPGLNVAPAVDRLSAFPSAPSSVVLSDSAGLRVSVDGFGRRTIEIVEDKK